VGDFLPLESSDPAVAAFLRRDGARAVLVVANLATTPRAGVTISSSDSALAPTRYTTRDLLGSATTTALDVAAGGRLQAYAPLASLDARRTYVIELTRTAR